MARLPFLIIVALIAAYGFAAPAVVARGGIDASLLANFNLMEQYASAAYCPNNANSAGDKVTCSSRNCPQVQSANTTTLVEFSSTKGTDITGYVAADDTNHLLIISFRGSSTFENWVTNLQMDMVTSDLCPGCTVHRGFWQCWQDSRAAILAAILAAATTRPAYTLVATGHSLGGAIATLAAARLRTDGYDVALYTFGAPRLGGAKVSDFVSNQGDNFRVTHWNDPVPNLPPMLFGYAHVSPEYYIDRGNLKEVGPKDFRVLHGNRNLGGNAAWLVTDVGAHLWYFGSIAQCAFDAIFGG